MRNTSAELALACAVAIVGCGPSNVFHGDLAFSLEERAEIDRAAAEMAERVGAPTIEIVWDGEIDDGSQRILRREPPGGGADGRYLMSSRAYEREIYVRPGLTLARVGVVMRHELGHWYSLDHHDGPGLMAKSAMNAWTEDDERECRRAGLCFTGSAGR